MPDHVGQKNGNDLAVDRLDALFVVEHALMIPLQNLLDRRVLTDLPEHIFELLFTEQVGRADFIGDATVDKVDQGLRDENLSNLCENGHLVSDLACRLLEHQKPLFALHEILLRQIQSLLRELLLTDLDSRLFQVLQSAMLDEGDQVHYQICGQAYRPRNRKKDPKHEFIGPCDSVAL